MPRHKRVWIALAVATLAALYVYLTPYFYPPYVSDFDQLWLAARAWRDGCDPYQVVGASLARDGYVYGLVYPFTAVVLVSPLSWFGLAAARAIFVAVASGTFAYVLLARGWWVYPILLSAAMRASVSSAQIAPLIAASVLLPAFGVVAAFKPNVAVAAWVAGRSRRDLTIYLAAASALALLSFALWPQWVPEWLAAARTGTGNRPLVMQPGGVLLLLAAFRCRDPSARWLLALALVPANTRMYDALPLLALLPQTHIQALTLAILSHVAELAAYAVGNWTPTYPATNIAHATVLLWAFYLPVMTWVLVRHEARSD